MTSPINYSYLFGNDTWSGWGPRFFYTFYSEFGDRGVAVGVEVTALLLILITSVAANLIIIAAIVRYREMRTVTNYFLLNLAVADVVFAVGIPGIATTRVTQEWLLGDMSCRLLPYSQFVCGFVLLWTLTLISVDRYRCIVVPPYRTRLTARHSLALVVTIWLVACLLFLPVAFWFREQKVFLSEGRSTTICTMVFPRSDTVHVSLCFIVPVLLVACICPMALLIFHYHKIFQKLLNTRNRWANPCVVNSAPGSILLEDAPESERRDSELSIGGLVGLGLGITWRKNSQPRGSLTQHEEVRFHKHLHVVRVLLLNVVVVLLMWLPITIMMVLIYLDGSRPNEDLRFFLRSHDFLWTLVIALLNTVVNPVLYGVLSENFRNCFSRMWRAMLSKNHLAEEVGISKSQLETNQEKTKTKDTSVKANGVAKSSDGSTGRNPNGCAAAADGDQRF